MLKACTFARVFIALALTLLTVSPMTSAMPFGWMMSNKTASQDGTTSLGTVAGVGSVPAPVTKITFSEDLIGQNSHTRRIQIVEVHNGTPVAVVSEIQFNYGVNATANVTFTLPNVATTVQGGNTLVAVSQHIGNGLAQPQGWADVQF